MRLPLALALLALAGLALASSPSAAQVEQSPVQSLSAAEVEDLWQQPSFVESLATQEIDVRSLTPEQFASMLQERNPLWMQIEASRHSAMLELDVELDEAAQAETETEAEAESEVDAQLLADLEAELDDTADAELDAQADMQAETEAEAEAEETPEAADRALVESEAEAEGPVGSGRTAGASGKVAGASGKVAGASGKVAGASGKVAGASGKVSGASGKVSGASGKVSGASGKVSGSADRHNPTVVQPLVTSKVQLTPYPGNPTANGYSKDKHECWYLYNMYHRRYGVQDKDTAAFNKNPLNLCTGSWPKHADRARLVRVYKELMSRPAGSPFVNRHVATKASSVSAQLQCGSCWAQAATGSFEVALKKAGTFKNDLSVQQLVDCVKGAAYPDSHGCKGGTPMDGLKYLQTHGHASEKAYPYTGKEGQCREQLGASGPKSKGWTMLSFDADTVRTTKHNYAACNKASCTNQWMYEMDVVFAIKNDGPFIAWVDASQWQHYTGGIFDAVKYCKSTTDAGNHIVELLGYGRQNGIPYWLVKNSWGNSWGENGFIKLPMGMNACGVFNYVGRAKP